MLKKLLSLFMVFAIFVGGCGGCGPAVFYQQVNTRYISSDAHVNHMMNSVIDFVERSPTGYRSFCSGFFVGPRMIATAAHCVSTRVEVFPGLYLSAPPVAGTQYNFATYQQWRISQTTDTDFIPHTARVVDSNAEEDVAILRLDDGMPSADDYLTMNTTTLRIGENVYVVSNPGHRNWILTEGVVSQIERRANGAIDSISTTANIWFGSSGSPLIDDNGNVIGVAVTISERQSYLGNFSPIRNVSRLLNQRR